MQNFHFSEQTEPHLIRRKELLKKYPTEIRALMGNTRVSALWILACVLTQFTAAWYLKDLGLVWTLGVAFVFGAYVNHALYVFIHEATHNLVFKSTIMNRFAGIFCDFALFAPGAMAFRRYHITHHNRQGEYLSDADIVSHAEADVVGNTTWKKLIWVFLMAPSQVMRPMRIKGQTLWDKWVVANVLIQILVVATSYYFMGPLGVLYFLASTVFGLGLHPLGGRWIAEHYVVKEGQETYSYYGPLSPIIFNVGYHNEHHDVMTIAWKNLPKLKALAPEYYDNLVSHKSYSKLLLRFIMDPKLHLKSRVLRADKGMETQVAKEAVESPMAEALTATE